MYIHVYVYTYLHCIYIYILWLGQQTLTLASPASWLTANHIPSPIALASRQLSGSGNVEPTMGPNMRAKPFAPAATQQELVNVLIEHHRTMGI